MSHTLTHNTWEFNVKLDIHAGKEHFVIIWAENLIVIYIYTQSHFCTVLIDTEFLRNSIPGLLKKECALFFGNLPRVVHVFRKSCHKSNTVHNFWIIKHSSFIERCQVSATVKITWNMLFILLYSFLLLMWKEGIAKHSKADLQIFPFKMWEIHTHIYVYMTLWYTHTHIYKLCIYVFVALGSIMIL